MPNLFLDRLPELSKSFRKEAGFTHRLSETPDDWSQEVGSELYKQLPFLSDYDVNVNLEKQDPGRGFAFGYADVTNKTERPEQEHEQSGIPHIRIPIVAEERQVRPFSVFLDGERVLPMGEERLRETLFNPATFDLSNSVPRDPSLVEPLMPPQRSGIGMGGEYKMASAEEAFVKESFEHISKPQWDAIKNSGKVEALVQKHGTDKHPEVINAMYELAASEYGFHPKVYPATAEQKMKQLQKSVDKASKDAPQVGGQVSGGKPAAKPAAGSKGTPAPKAKTASLLTAIASTIRESDRDAFVEKIASDPTLRAGFRRSGIAGLLVEVMDTKLASASDRLSTIADNIEPSVVTFQKLPGGDFMVKAANVNAFAGGEQAAGQVVPFAEVAEAIGEESARSMQPGQIATAVSDPIEVDGDDSNASSPVSEFGEYKVQDADGKQMKGWVFPEVYAWDGDFTPQKTNIFVGGSGHAIQSELTGERINADPSVLQTDIPKGEGIFRASSGRMATAPIDIQYGVTGADGVSKYIGTDSFGNEIKVSVIPGLKEPQKISDTAFAIPQSWQFTKLHDNKVDLVSSSEHVGTRRKLRKEKTSAVLFYNGAFNITGGCGLDKVASDLRQDLDAVGAEFIVGLLGVDGVAAKQKVAEARRKGFVKMSGLKTICPLSERFEQSVKTASSLLSRLPNLRRDLLKEAASIEDQGTVDKVLALNFINPENLSTFIEYLPQLEECSEKMAEMVLAGYLGQKEIPIGAVERSMKNMEEVIAGLKAVQSSQT